MSINKKAYYLAKKEIGISEINGDEANKRIIEYHSTTTLKSTSDEISWCSAFMNWCVLNAGGQPTFNALARSWLNWGIMVNEPIESDIAILKRGNDQMYGHVGFYVEENETHIKLLGGNQSNKVCMAWYPKESVIGYRRDKIEEPEIY